MRWIDDIKSVSGLSVNDLNQLVKDRKTWNLLVNNIAKKRKRTNIYSLYIRRIEECRSAFKILTGKPTGKRP